jgi:hypothetical protein
MRQLIALLANPPASRQRLTEYRVKISPEWVWYSAASMFHNEA